MRPTPRTPTTSAIWLVLGSIMSVQVGAAVAKTVMDEAFKQAMALYDELSNSNPNWKKIYADYSNFRKDQNLWFRFTEATFDRYMQSAKL